MPDAAHSASTTVAREAVQEGKALPVVNARDVVGWMVRSAALATSERRLDVELQLEPRALGRMKVNLEIVADVLTARLEVQHSAARELVESQLPVLQNRLAESGLRVERIEVALAPFVVHVEKPVQPDLQNSLTEEDPNRQRQAPQSRQPKGQRRGERDNFLDYLG